ncbi:MAG TPA: septal ring lytic transglycosylase RlpA family protein, partial [Terracidiphilus sp.]|nr:septal ring lytic transglycosylase RlpA family protein [Terracidiphilus sp.]
MRQFLSNLNPNAPVPFWTLVGATSAGLVWVILSLSTQAVHADAQFTVPVESAPVASAVAQPTPVNVSQPQQALLHGVASWYGPRFNGRTTASGEQFDMNAMTACHPNLPFGSVVRVTNLTNHKSVVVRINDRG